MRRTARACIVTFTVLACVTVLVGAAGFYLSYNLQAYRSDVADAVSEMLERPIEVGSLSLSWHNWVPLLAVDDLSIKDESGVTLAGFKRAEFSIDVASSIATVSLKPTSMRILGAQLSMRRDAAGAVTISGLGSQSTSQEGMTSARRLLLGPTRIAFTDAKLLFYDARLGDQALVLGLRMDMVQQGSAQVVRGVLEVPGEVPELITVDGQLSLSAGGAGWLADLNIRAGQLNLEPLAPLLPRSSVPGKGASADFDLRLRFTDGKLTRASGAAQLENLNLLPGDPLPGPNSFGGAFRYGPVDKGWEMVVTDLRTKGAVSGWAADTAAIRFKLGENGHPGSYSAELSHAQIEDVLAMVAYLEPTSRDVAHLRAYQMTGAATNVTATWLSIDDADVPFSTAFTFDNLGWPERTDQNWGFRGLSGHASLSPVGGFIKLATNNPVPVSAFEVFAKPPTFDSVHGTINVRTSADSIALHSDNLTLSNDQYSVNLSGSILVDEAPSAKLAVDVEVPRIPTEALQALLPSPMFPRGLNSWFADSVKGGELHELHIALRGRASELQTAPQDDSVVMHTELHNTQLTYARGWPALKNLNGSISLEGGKLEAKASAARLGDSEIRILATVDNIDADDAPVGLRVSSEGKLANMLKTFLDSPLAANMPKELEALEAHGNARIDARLKVHSDGSVNGARTDIQLRDVTLAPGRGLTPVEALNGTLTVAGRQIKSSKLKGRWLGQAVQLDLTGNAKGAGKLTIEMPVGPSTLDEFAALAYVDMPKWAQRVAGKSPWRAQITASAEGNVAFEIDSQLVGTAIALPAPVGKAAASARPMRINGTVTSTRIDVAARYGPINLNTSALRRKREDVGFNLHFNQTAKPAAIGKRTITGSLPLLDIDAWTAFIGSTTTGVSEIRQPSIDVTLDLLRFAGISFPRTRVSTAGIKSEGNSTFVLDGPNIAGRVIPPADKQPLRIDLDRLVVPEARELKGPRTDPTTIPTFTFLTKHLIYDNVDLGNLKVAAIATPQGLKLDTIYLISPLFDLSGSGNWAKHNSQQRTDIALQIHANELRNVLLAAGVQKKTTTGGATRINAQISWAGTPGEISMAALDGELQFYSGSGRILSVDTGPGGKLFALLNLRSLPQILSLDFGSFLSEGLEYETIRGNFTLDAGNAYTNDLTLRSSTAKITVAGRTGLVTEDYDQTINVRPSLTDSLPVAGAAFGGVGAGVGAVLWLAEKILNTKVVDEVASFRYTVKGPWSKPTITKDVQKIEQLSEQ